MNHFYRVAAVLLLLALLLCACTPQTPEHPDDPSDPSGPSDPTDPIDPTDPTDPTDPIDPIDPIDPTDPTDPTDPIDPTDPTDPKPSVVREPLTFSGAESRTLSSSTYAAGSVFFLHAPQRTEGQRFSHWERNGTRFSVLPDVTLTMTGETVTVTAVYIDSTVVRYDKARGTDLKLAVASDAAPKGVYGMALTDCDWSWNDGTLTVSGAALDALAAGEYSLLLDFPQGREQLAVAIADSRALADVRVVYDSVHFPLPELRFACACGGKHTYKLDGGTTVDCRSGDAVREYDKSTAHTLTLRCSETGLERVLSIPAADETAMEYYGRSYQFCGETRDFVVEDFEQLCHILRYLSLVEAPVRCETDGTMTGDFRFYIADTYAAEFCENESALMQEALSMFSFPMNTDIAYALDGQTLIYRLKFTGTFNTRTSDQQKTEPYGDAAFASETGRAGDYDDFAVEKNTAVQPIRTVYELGLLPLGVRPEFVGDGALAAQAKATYEEAKRVLRSIVDDGMSDYEKVLAIYEYLARTVTYDTHLATEVARTEHGNYTSFTAYGALIDHVAVCDGFAGAFRLLCVMEGIPCNEIVGTMDGGGHAWNKYQIDGVWYACDVTWARDSMGNVSMAYVFMDEGALLDTKHLENGWLSHPFSEICADAPFDYFRYAIIGDGVDLEVASQEELAAVIVFLVRSGEEKIEICYSADAPFADAVRKAFSDLPTDLQGTYSFSYVTRGDRYIHIFLK